MTKRSKGFTLVELSVAFVIIVLLLAGAMIPLSTQIELRSIADTQRNMEQIREAIIGFAQANGRLPCPANGAIPSGTANAGIEQLSGVSPNRSCTQPFGAVPWTTLGVPEADSWGRRFSYWVDPNFADEVGSPLNNTFGCPAAPNPVPTQSSLALCSLGVLTVNTRNETTRALAAIGAVLPAVIISHGKNGLGAFTVAGATLSAPPGADEIANANHTAGANTFVSRGATPRAGGCNDALPAQPLCEFDDIVVMISTNALIARMVAAGRLP